MRSMRARARIVAILAVMAVPAWAQSQVLFDGQSLAGWEGDPRFWRAEGGILVGESTPGTPCERSTYLVWQGPVPEDFRLSLEFRIVSGNSGIQFRSEDLGEQRVAGYQADLDAAGEWTGGLYEQDGRGVIARRGERVRRTATESTSWSLGERAQLLGDVRAGRWSSYEIVAHGARVELWLDGRRTCSFLDEDPRFLRTQGVLALQLHAGPPMRVEYRKLELSASEPFPERAQEQWDSGPSPLESAPADVPRWIWSAPQSPDGERVWFFREFELEGVPELATLEGTCDNRMRVLVNGDEVLASSRWWEPRTVQVEGALRAGRNLIAVEATNEGGPAGLELALDAAGERLLVTDARWSCARTQPPGWDAPTYDLAGTSPALELEVLGHGTWGELAAPKPPARDESLPAADVVVAAGYEVERVFSVPAERYGSWVALTFDPAGRAIVSNERGGLYRVSLPTVATPEPRVETIDDELGCAQGLLALEGTLYVVAHPRGELAAGLYRLRDVDGDDRYEEREFLLAMEGSGEHGPHAVLLEPDGRHLALLAGNYTRMPELVSSRVPRVWDEDQLLPRRDDPGGHANGLMAPGGWILRTDLDGAAPQLVASGLRNTYDMAFGPDGELFAYDADMEWDIGLGWYRAPRVLHAVSGAEFGWRNGSGKWPSAWPDSLPSVVDTDLSSPVGVLYGAALEGFAARERRSLFLGDWAYGRILAVDLEPDGASWSGRVRPFVSGEPLPLTDLAAGPDGDLYFTVGGRGTQSGLYRVSAVQGQRSNEGEQSPWPEADLRTLRRRLEEFHGRADEDALDLAFEHLDHPDRFVRSAARVAIESQEPGSWRERALDERRPRAAVQAAVALAHTNDASLAHGTTAMLALVPLDVADEELCVGVLRALGLVEIRLGGIPRAQREALLPRLEQLLPCGRDRLDRELVRLLVRLRSSNVLAPALELLEAAQDSEQATHYAFCLVELGSGWSSEHVARYAAWLDAAPERFEGGASLRGYLQGLRADARERLGLEVAPIEPSSSDPALFARPFVRAWKAEELHALVPELSAGRSFENGRAMAVAARCSECHSVRGDGGRTGPDLTGVASRLSARDLIEAIVEPSRVVSDQYQDTELLTSEDRLLVGRVVGEADGVVRFLTLPPNEHVIELDASEIQWRRPHPLSRMPSGLLDTLGRDDVLDLLSFLLARGEPEDPRFQR